MTTKRQSPPFDSIGRRCYQSRDFLEDVPLAIAAAVELFLEEAAWLPSDQGVSRGPYTCNYTDP
jgi:hypothetical protein